MARFSGLKAFLQLVTEGVDHKNIDITNLKIIVERKITDKEISTDLTRKYVT